MVISGVYTPDIFTVDFTGATAGPKHIVHVSEGPGTMNGNVCAVSCDVSAGAVDGTLTVNRGTWNGTTFTLIQRLAFVAVLAGTTQPQTILNVLGKDEALQFVVTGNGSTKGHVRIQGKTKAV